MNNRDATIAGLQKLGYQEVQRSRKYRCFQEPKPSGVPFRTFLVGKKGALRLIRAQDSTISDAHSMTDSKQHKAFQFIGRINQELPLEKFQELHHKYLTS